MKPIAKFMLTIPALCTLFACGAPDSSQSAASDAPAADTSASAADDADLTLAVIPKSTGGEFWETVEHGARQAANDLDVTIKWEGTLTESEIAEQNKIIENMINLGVDGMALAPLNAKAMRKSVENVAANDIPVVIFDSAVEGDAYVSFVATDNYQGGVLGAQEMIRLLGDPAGKRIMVQRFVQGTGSTEARASGFIDTVTDAGATVVADPYPEDGAVAGSKRTASNTFEGFIENGRLNLDGVFACNLYSALGVAAALDDLRKSGIEVDAFYIGFDTSPKLIEALQAGDIDALVAQNPERMGYLAVETLTRHLRGEDVPDQVDTGVELITLDALANSPELRQLAGLE